MVAIKTLNNHNIHNQNYKDEISKTRSFNNKIMSKPIKTKEDLKLFADCLFNYYDGFYVKSDAHPCGWDYIDTTGLADIEDLMNLPIIAEDISNGNYKWHFYEDMSVFDILKEVGKDWCFEKEEINWIDDKIIYRLAELILKEE